MSALALQSRDVALELHRLLRDMDPSRTGRRWDAEALMARARELATQFRALLSSEDTAPDSDVVATHVDQVATMLSAAPELPAGSRSAWSRYRKELLAAYEELGRALRRASVEVPSVRPTNYTRSIVHAGMAIVCVLLIEMVLTETQRWVVPLIAALSFWGMEAWRHTSDTGRRVLLWVFGPIAHPHERHRINSGTYFGTALAILGLCFSPMIAAAAVMILGLADPAAGLAGRKWGRIKLINQRSLIGTVTFVVVGTLAALLVLSLWHANLGWSQRFAIAGLAALFGGLGELFSNRVIDDNLAVPVSAAVGGWLALQLLGL